MASTPASLTYRHSIELLAGSIGSKTISYHAACGGFRGSTTPGKARFDRKSYDPKLPKSALPKGKYKLAYLGAPYKHYAGGAVLLWPSDQVLNTLNGSTRSTNDFLIHGPGKIGSEGCIVLYHGEHYKEVMKKFKEAYGTVDWSKSDSEKWHGTLEVVDEPVKGWEKKMLDYFDPFKQRTA
ncbi:MAG: hypothetical protein AAFZ99_06635 [Pseudomonadota bacterium]